MNDLDQAPKPKHPGGRPTKRTPEVVAAIMDAYAEGLSFENACRVAGIAPSTGFLWQDEPEFLEELERARAVGEYVLLKEMTKVPNWQVFAWKLERRNPKSYARPEVQLNQQINIQGSVNVTKLYEVNAQPLQALLHGKTLELPDNAA